ncbi:MAG: Leucine-tRNA ligase [Parcubacteria group bacterium GW2011_GWF2_38_76]|nr:MAG: Leucine-tRNA ligase [Parcubacteria group bacterium GW2011_GWF2_38_76]HBM46060.1 leucine--tRNA ligase [Patescibacteria group bacterium]
MKPKQYDHKKIESTWQKKWNKAKLFKTETNTKKPKCFVLDMFPYPSGDGLHVGHPKGYIATDVYSRYKKMNGFNVLHPMGWDAFGLPAENYAIKNKIHPEVAVKKNIKRFKDQLQKIGFNYDWEREINTTDPAYYKWTQWVFLKLLEKGLAHESFEPINWCPSCQTGLANEDLDGDVCERCGSVVEKKPMRQWVLKITKYADRMLEDLDQLPWPDSIKELQRNWIGKSEGAEVDFKIKGRGDSIKIFTTRIDTIDGVTYLVLAPEHPLLKNNDLGIQNYSEVKKYIEEVKNKPEIERTAEKKEKTGVPLNGISVINPFNGDEVPLWVADYVLGHYGTGAVMAVPEHDERDREFATKFGLPIINRPLVNINETIKKVGGAKTIKYKLKDWVFSRQRYWGEPIPVAHCEKCGVVPVPEKDLPVMLPKVKSYAPTGTGESPLADIAKWVNTKCPKCKGPAKRETNTMPQWAGSCWYYLRYVDPKNKKEIVGKKAEKYFMPVDVYVGGAEHATRHLIYARFWHKFLYDIGVVSHIEPFTTLHSVGLILAEDGRKMSKRWGNVINPDDVVATYGADTLRIYEMFMGPFSQAIAWKSDNMIGGRRFLEKVWRLQFKIDKKIKADEKLESRLHETIKKVSEDIESFGFNTAISTMMIFVNELEGVEKIPQKVYESLLLLLSPFAPHMTDEIWHILGNKKFIYVSAWPKLDTTKIKKSEINLTLQVNGKVRDNVMVSAHITEDEAKKIAVENEIVKRNLEGKEIKKIIYVKGRLVNIVAI